MGIKGWALSMGIGAAAGAVAILMMQKNKQHSQLAAKAACKVADAAFKVPDHLT